MELSGAVAVFVLSFPEDLDVREAGLLEELVQLLAGVARALVDLRVASVVHRDLKPSNVILREGDVRHPVLVDFGLSRSGSGQRLTAPHELRGSAGYMAPEYMLGEEVDHRSDLYSLGMTALYAASAERPFPQLDGLPLIKRLCEESPPVDNVPARLRTVVASLVRLLPADRCSSPRRLLAVLSGDAELSPLVPSLFSPEVFRIVRNVGVMLGLDFDPVSASNGWPLPGQRAAIDIGGAWTGRVFVECTEIVARRLGVGFLGIPEEELEAEDLQDAMAEVANVVAGQIKQLLPQPATMSLPFVPLELPGPSSRALVVCARWRRELLVVSIQPSTQGDQGTLLSLEAG